MPGPIASMVVLISGGASGMGAAQARHLSDLGASVVVADIVVDRAEALARDLAGKSLAVGLDVRDPDQWADALRRAADAFGPVTGLVNNAGIPGGNTLIEHTSATEYESVVAVNQIGMHSGIRACIPAMRAAGGGSIVLISSVLGTAGMAGSAAYVSTKFAIRGLARVAALELARDSIRVNCICPGAVDTAMLRSGADESRALDAISRQVPLRQVADPHEIAKAAAFLLSDDSSYITGSDLVVDGGVTARLPLNLNAS